MRPQFLYTIVFLMTVTSHTLQAEEKKPSADQPDVKLFDLLGPGADAECKDGVCRVPSGKILKLKRKGRFKFLRHEEKQVGILGQVIESRDEVDLVFQAEYDRKEQGERPRPIYILVARSDQLCVPCNTVKEYLFENRDRISDKVIVLMVDPVTQEGAELYSQHYNTGAFGRGYVYKFDDEKDTFVSPITLDDPAEIQKEIETDLSKSPRDG